MRLVAAFIAVVASAAHGLELVDIWKKPGWTCDVKSASVVTTDSKGAASKFLTCVLSVDCESSTASVFLNHGCRTTLKNACPSVDDCVAQSVDALKAKDLSLVVSSGMANEKDGTLKTASAEQKAIVEAEYGNGCKFTPEGLVSVVYRKMDPKQKDYDELCVNRVSCDLPSKRGVVKQLACPALGHQEKKGEDYSVCPQINDCLASAVQLTKPTRALVAHELPARPRVEASTTKTGNGSVDVATHSVQGATLSNAALSK